MTCSDEALVTDRMRRALLAFQSALNLLLAVHQRLHGEPMEEIEAFWLAPGGRIERHVYASATDVIAAFQVFSAAGLVTNTIDQHGLTQAQQYLAAVEAQRGHGSSSVRSECSFYTHIR
jgi:hypothetical protein